ncbi:hypothetical protein [Numidum massiliense]|uniref:hypothetical protein n=1 Tax=Numidum massiliense TaxID=1522315 RepID=UPI0006D5564A|nr:hypothetical protein [Numidum massiliense]
MQLRKQLEQLRAILYTGKPQEAAPTLTQEEYIERFEARIARDPAVEWQALVTYGRPLVPQYRARLADIHRMARLLQGDDAPAPPTDDEALLKQLYEEMMELETEQEWQTWANQWSEQVEDRK